MKSAKIYRLILDKKILNGATPKKLSTFIHTSRGGFASQHVIISEIGPTIYLPRLLWFFSAFYNIVHCQY